MDSPEIINLSSNDSLKSSNFGPGIELLMNDKTTNRGPKNDNIDLEDISALEAELKPLAMLAPTELESGKDCILW